MLDGVQPSLVRVHSIIEVKLGPVVIIEGVSKHTFMVNNFLERFIRIAGHAVAELVGSRQKTPFLN